MCARRPVGYGSGTWVDRRARLYQAKAHAAIRNLVGVFRREGFTKIVHARRYYGREGQRILTLYGYAWRALLTGVTVEPVSGLQDLRIDTGEAVISVSCGGAGPAVLLLHGFPQTKLMWRDIAPRLARRFTVVTSVTAGLSNSSPQFVPLGNPGSQ